MQRIKPLAGYAEPATLEEAAQLLYEQGGKARVLAGGTDLIVTARRKDLGGLFLVNIKKIAGLSGVVCHADGSFDIGALTTVSELEALPQSGLRVLRSASASLGSRSVRNRATIGGNIGRASPASDLACPLIVLDATVRLFGTKGMRSVPAAAFFLGPGRADLRPGEIIRSIHIPPQGSASGWYAKRGRTGGCDCAQAGIAVQLRIEDGIIKKAGLALSAVAPTPLPAANAARMLTGQRIGKELFERAAKAAAEDAQPITDFRASAGYRRILVQSLAFETLTAAAR